MTVKTSVMDFVKNRVSDYLFVLNSNCFCTLFPLFYAMCTVTFIPKSETDFILTSNRDEAPGRATFPPQIYTEDGVDTLYPRDAVAGGTWIGVSKRKRAVTLMNGGFVAHKRKPYYGRSRGLIVKDLLKAADVQAYLDEYDFEPIEPFTAICVDFTETIRLTEVVWTGEELVVTALKPENRIWSSSPLYPPEIARKRETWFADLIESSALTSDFILEFHRTAGDGNPHNNLVMDRVFVKTKSTTQIIKSATQIGMTYRDLETESHFFASL